MSKVNYKEEFDFLQKYMDAKNSGGTGLDQMIETIISKYLIPQQRLIEANSWLVPIEDSKISSKLKLAVAQAESESNLPEIKRIPKNKNWLEVDLSQASVKTDDQQIHYDRFIAILNLRKTMSEDRDDVFECRNEWISYMAYSAYGTDDEHKLADLGFRFTTIAMAYHDYIENILLPNKFVELSSDIDEEESQSNALNTVENAYANSPETIEYLKKNHPQILKDGFLTNFYCYTKILGSEEEVMITDSYVAFLPAKKKGWSAGIGHIINRSSITEISVGSEYHIEHQGFTSSESAYWTLTFATNNYQTFTRYLYLGRDEREMNQRRPALGNTLQKLGNYFPLVEGDSYSSSGGYTTSFGFGWWV